MARTRLDTYLTRLRALATFVFMAELFVGLILDRGVEMRAELDTVI